MPAFFEICFVVVPSRPFSWNNSSAAARIFSFVFSLFRSRLPAGVALLFVFLGDGFINMSALIYLCDEASAVKHKNEHTHICAARQARSKVSQKMPANQSKTGSRRLPFMAFLDTGAFARPGYLQRPGLFRAEFQRQFFYLTQQSPPSWPRNPRGGRS